MKNYHEFVENQSISTDPYNFPGSGSVFVSNDKDLDPTKTTENRKYVPTKNRDFIFYRPNLPVFFNRNFITHN